MITEIRRALWYAKGPAAEQRFVQALACEKARKRTDKNVHFVRLGTQHFKVFILVRGAFSIEEGLPFTQQAADATGIP